MTQSSYFWGGTATGHATSAPYDNLELSAFFNIMFCRYPYTGEGVIYGYLNGLEVTNPSGNQILINTGAAMVNGYLYINSSSEGVSVVDPGGGNTNYYTLRLQCDTTAQTVLIYLGSPSLVSYPARTFAAPTYEIILAYISVNAGTVTVTDSRYYLHTPSMVPGAQIDDASVDYTKAGEGLPILPERIGDSATQWTTPTTLNGSPIQTVDAVKMACGAVTIAVNTGAHAITFPSAFSGAPLVFVQQMYPISNYEVTPVDITNIGFVIQTEIDFLPEDIPAYWLAIGPA